MTDFLRMILARWCLLIAVSIAVVFAAIWGADSSEPVAGPRDFEGQPVLCGETQWPEEQARTTAPSKQQWRRARRSLPNGQALALNEYTGELEAVPVMKLRLGEGHVTMPEQTAYRCAPDGRPRLLPLSEADPAAAARYRRRVEAELVSSEVLTGLGSAPDGRGQHFRGAREATDRDGAS